MCVYAYNVDYIYIQLVIVRWRLVSIVMWSGFCVLRIWCCVRWDVYVNGGMLCIC